MATTTLLLGPILFQDFELPPAITWGGAQSLTVHRLPGGTRIIDAMGRDDAEITWSGVFAGTDCSLRAQAVDLMRAGGASWPLIWDTFFYSVVIQRFDADYRRPNWIPYRISCTVLRDEAESLVEEVLSLATSTLADLAAATDFATSLNLAAATSAVSASGATTIGTAAYSQAQTQLGGAVTAASTQLATTGQQLTGAASLSQATLLSGQTAQLAGALGYLQRASVNLANASS